MTPIYTHRNVLAAALLTLGSLAGGARAALAITNFDLQSNSISFDISGTIDGPFPQQGARWLFLVDSSGNGNYDDASFQTATISSNISLNGSPDMVSDFWIENDDILEDRLTLNFSTELNIADVLAGHFEATWIDPVDTAPLTSGMEFRWGRNNSTAMEGTLQGQTSASSPVPEPSAAILFGLGALALTSRRKRSC